MTREEQDDRLPQHLHMPGDDGEYPADVQDAARRWVVALWQNDSSIRWAREREFDWLLSLHPNGGASEDDRQQAYQRWIDALLSWAKSNTSRYRTCPICGTAFAVTDQRMVYDSPKCSAVARARKYRKTRQGVIITG